MSRKAREATEAMETDNVPAGPRQITRGPGELIWVEGEEVRPLRIQQGVVAYRRGRVAIGLLGPGQVALPTPGVGANGRAVSQLVAITETTAAVEENAGSLTPGDLEPSARAVVTGADRLGNMFLPQRLAALLLD